ncbi:MAG TPA: CoA-binding protein [Bryobacteraceae bacterium]|jgi:predicted CoA-binding protein
MGSESGSGAFCLIPTAFEDGVGGNSAVNGTTFAMSAAARLNILSKYRRIAMVGLSSNQFRPSYFAALYLLAEGYEVIPVNPREKSILGQTCYPTLAAVPGPIEVVDIFRDPSAVPAIVEEAIAVGAKAIWMQLGVIHEAAAERARAAGLEVVMDRCMKIEHARFFGGLNTIGLNTGVISSKRRPR